MKSFKYNSEENLQTPLYICRYMISMIPDRVTTILDPTPGKGNLIKLLNDRFIITAPDNFFEWNQQKVDCVIMNPPFTANDTNFNNAPEYVKKLTGSKIVHYFLFQMMNISENIIAIVPWYTIINSKKRTNYIKNFGMISVTNLPRSVFKRSLIQTCVLQLKKGYQGETIFKQY